MSPSTKARTEKLAINRLREGERLLTRGEWMYREDTVFRKTVRAEV